MSVTHLLDPTPREGDIMRAVAEGLTNAEIAERDHYAVEPVKFHLSNSFRKLGAANRTHAVRRAIEEGWITAPIPLDAEVRACPHCGKAYAP